MLKTIYLITYDFKLSSIAKLSLLKQFQMYYLSIKINQNRSTSIMLNLCSLHTRAGFQGFMSSMSQHHCNLAQPCAVT